MRRFYVLAALALLNFTLSFAQPPASPESVPAKQSSKSKPVKAKKAQKARKAPADHPAQPAHAATSAEKAGGASAQKEVWKCQGCGMTHNGPGRCCGMELKKI